METLEVIFEDIYNPVIQDIDTEKDDNERFKKILKMIENLQDKKVNEVLTINYVLKKFSDKQKYPEDCLSLHQQRAL